ncbi:AcrR family transcriptional regulator [Clostridium acetobutylicum]|nr:AcrR family transcriptional regulator [Clostridium acetobutylicum]
MGINKRKETEKLNRKISIIDAAERVFFIKGFYNATMDDVAKEAEFTKKTIYSYFTSKEEIYYEIMLRGYKILNSMNYKMLEERRSESEIQNIRMLGEVYIEFTRLHHGYFKAILEYKNNELLKNENVREELFNEVYEEGEYSLRLLRDIIERGMEKKEIIEEYSSLDISLTLWSCILGFSSISMNKENYTKKFYNRNSEEVLKKSFEIILNSIRRK